MEKQRSGNTERCYYIFIYINEMMWWTCKDYFRADKFFL